ncbi:MAG: hypothetical protein KF773_14670 [Deltaproteobacteria bacterium]|nr:hypothetical protein [Deltaproteobacteria bacterium]
MGWVEDAIEYPWDDEGEELRRVLAARYETTAEVRQLVKSARVPTVTKVDFTGAIDDVWASVLNLAIKERALPSLLRYIRRQLLPAETVTLLDGLLAPRPFASHELIHVHHFDLRTLEDECVTTIAATSGHVGLAFYCPCEPIIDYVAGRVATRLRPVNNHHKLNTIGGIQGIDVAILRLTRLRRSLDKMNVFVAVVAEDCKAASDLGKALKQTPNAKHRLIVLIQIKSQIRALRDLQPLEAPSFQREHIESWCRSVLTDRGWKVEHLDRMLAAFLVGHESDRLDHELTYERLNVAITLLKEDCCEDDFVKVWDP